MFSPLFNRLFRPLFTPLFSSMFKSSEQSDEWILNFNGTNSYMQYATVWAAYSDSFELHFNIRNVIGDATSRVLVGTNAGLFQVYALNSKVELQIPLDAGGTATFSSSSFGQDGGDKQISVYRAGDSWRVVTDIDDETEEITDSASINLTRVGTGGGVFYLNGSVYDLYITDNSPIQDTNVVEADGVSLYADLGVSLVGDFDIKQTFIFPSTGTLRLWGNSTNNGRCYIVTSPGTQLSITGASGGSASVPNLFLVAGQQYTLQSTRVGSTLTILLDGVSIFNNAGFGSADINDILVHRTSAATYGTGAILQNDITVDNGDVYSYDLTGEDGDTIPNTDPVTGATEGTWFNYDQLTDQLYIEANSRYYPIGDQGSNTQADELGDGSTDGTLHNVNHSTDWEAK